METGKELLSKVSSIKGTDSVATEKNRATIAGGTIGLLFGLYYGYSKRKNMLVTAVLGAAVGAISSRLLMPK